MSQLQTIQKAVNYINKKTKNFKPDLAIITGSGLANAIPPLEKEIKIPYVQIPGFLQSTVQGHTGNLLFGIYKNVKIVIMQGRFHYYEGHSIKDISIAIRTLKFLGVETLLLSAAVGSLDRKLPPGSMLILKDHINFMGTNPLIGNWDPVFGPMFKDMTQAYDEKLQNILVKIAKKHKIKHKKGVYFAVTGPCFETPAEIKAYRKLGADVVGMSVVPETIVARQLDLKVAGVALVSNLASGMSGIALSHKETLDVMKQSESKFAKLLRDFIIALKK